MNKISKKATSILIVIYILVVLAALWIFTSSLLPPGYILAGHDSGLALDTKGFLASRFFAWDQHLGFGEDNSLNFGSITLHLIDYLLSASVQSQYAGGQLSVLFWLLMIFLSAVIFAVSLRSKVGNTFVFLFPVFATVNFFLFQSLFMLERAKYGLYAALIIFLTIIFKVTEGKISVVNGGLVISMIFFIFNGGSLWGLPLYGGVFITAGTFAFYFLIQSFKQKSFHGFKRLISLFLISGIGYLMLSSYALVPFIGSITSKGAFTSIAGSEVVKANKEWLDVISRADSYLNLFRLQGVPSWYKDGTIPDPGHPYSANYLTQWPNVVVSFIFPILIFLSIIFVKDKKQKTLVLYFTLLALVAIFFSAGSHRPLGFIYSFLYDYFPGFSMFRTPYYKFGSALLIAMSFLLAFMLTRLTTVLSEKVKVIWLRDFVASILVIAIIVVWLGYHSVLFSNSVLLWTVGHSTKVQIPPYVQDYKNWIDKNNPDHQRILLVPSLSNDLKSDAYDWGYWSLSTLPSMLTNEPTLANHSTLKNTEIDWVNALYRSIENEQEQKTMELSSKLGVGFFLLRNDIDLRSVSVSVKNYEKILNSFEALEIIQRFDKWVLYRVRSLQNPKFKTTVSVVQIPDGHAYLAQELSQNNHVFFKGNKEMETLIQPFLSKELFVYPCQSCLLEKGDALTILPSVRILPNSPFYIIKKLKEQKALLNAKTNQAKIDAYLGFVVRRASEVKNMLDYGVKDRLILEELQIINSYLDNLYQVLSPISDLEEIFFEARKISDSLNTVEVNFREYSKRHEYLYRDEDLREEIKNMLWSLYKLKTLYNPLIGNKKVWETEKLYFFDLAEKGKYKVMLNVSSLPLSEQGEPMMPLSIELSQGQTKINLEPDIEQNNWLEIPLENIEQGKSVLKLIFKELPNLYVDRGSRIEQSLTKGSIACYVGNINFFHPGQTYRVEVLTSKKDQNLRLYFKEEIEQKKLNNFLRGQDEVAVYPIVTNEPFIYHYQTWKSTRNPTLYLCSEDRELPIITKFGVYASNTPLAVVAKDHVPKYQLTPIVTTQQVDPTKYIIDVKNAFEPYVLIFNERYNSLWQLTLAQSNSKTENNSKHFMVDGYANGWLVDQTGDYTFVLEYKPQRLFFIGKLFTVFTLFCYLVFWCNVFYKRIKK